MIPVLHGVWAAAGGLVGDFEHIETQTVGAGGSSGITFSSIPGTYKHLQIRGIGKGTVGDGDTNLRFNSDTGTNYSLHRLRGDGSAASSLGYATQDSMWAGFLTTTQFGGMVTDILDYASTSKYKTIRTLTGGDNNGSGIIALTSGSWRNTNAVTSITVFNYSGTLAQHSSFSLYGVK